MLSNIRSQHTTQVPPFLWLVGLWGSTAELKFLPANSSWFQSGAVRWIKFQGCKHVWRRKMFAIYQAKPNSDTFLNVEIKGLGSSSSSASEEQLRGRSAECHPNVNMLIRFASKVSSPFKSNGSIIPLFLLLPRIRGSMGASFITDCRIEIPHVFSKSTNFLSFILKPYCTLFPYLGIKSKSCSVTSIYYSQE